MTERKQDWAQLLEIYIWDRAQRPFKWGVQDCCSFAAEWVNLATGIDVNSKYRGTYKTALGALRHVALSGGVGGIPGKVGLRKIKPQMVQRGDIVGVATKWGLALGIHLGNRAAFPGKNGLQYRTPQFYMKAWRV